MAARQPRSYAAAILVSAMIALVLPSLPNTQELQAVADGDPLGEERLRHEQEVMKSVFCRDCHPDIYAEHEQNTHGRAFTDEEVRLATGRFSQGDCIVCHTPRPVFETGIGMNPKRRHFDLEEGNTCMTCHWMSGFDYSTFVGGAQCKTAFDPRVGTVEACASCHRNHGTPYQWEQSPLGKGKDRVCIDCHMASITRPVAVGEAPREVRSHIFPGGRSESQLRKAYSYQAELVGNEVVITIKNRGAGHNFPTELKQRSLESVVIVRDSGGTIVGNSRMVLRDPYKRPYGLHLPVNTQIPSGQEVTHRVPVTVASGSIDCELHYKLYFPIEDHHPDLSRQLESRRFLFDGITPSTQQIETDPVVQIQTPNSLSPEVASPANLVDFAHPPIGKVEVQIPEGSTPETIARLIELFQFPVPEANEKAQKQLSTIGEPAIPALVAALGSWDNKTYSQSMAVLGTMGEKALPALIEALSHAELYVRLHARELVARLGSKDSAGVAEKVSAGLKQENALDRASSADLAAALRLTSAVPELRGLLRDRDPDVVRAAAFALSKFNDQESIPKLREAISRFMYDETRRDLAVALAHLKCADAVPILIQGLDHRDDLIRESFFERFFECTALHFGYDAQAPRDERLEAIARIAMHWSAHGGVEALKPWPVQNAAKNARGWKILTQLGEGIEGVIDGELVEELIAMGEDAVPTLIIGLKYPPGFAEKRAYVCEALGEIRSRRSVPSLVSALRDPVIQVAAWAAWALESVGDTEALGPLERLYHRLLSMQAANQIPAVAGPADVLLAQVARARLKLGERVAARDLVQLLVSNEVDARSIAFNALFDNFGSDYGYDPMGSTESRREALERWTRAVN